MCCTVFTLINIFGLIVSDFLVIQLQQGAHGTKKHAITYFNSFSSSRTRNQVPNSASFVLFILFCFRGRKRSSSLGLSRLNLPTVEQRGDIKPGIRRSWARQDVAVH